MSIELSGLEDNETVRPQNGVCLKDGETALKSVSKMLRLASPALRSFAPACLPK